jgi:hypothetical protein
MLGSEDQQHEPDQRNPTLKAAQLSASSGGFPHLRWAFDVRPRQ